MLFCSPRSTRILFLLTWTDLSAIILSWNIASLVPFPLRKPFWVSDRCCSIIGVILLLIRFRRIFDMCEIKLISRKSLQMMVMIKETPGRTRRANMGPSYRCWVADFLPRTALCFSRQWFFSNMQYGFLKGRSTVLQLLNIIDEWTLNLGLRRTNWLHIYGLWKGLW